MIAVLIAVALAAVRLARGDSVRMVALSVAVVLALSLSAVLTGQGRGFYLPHLAVNVVLALVFGLTVTSRRPISGEVCRRLRLEPVDWFATRTRVRLHRRITAAWFVYWMAHLVVMAVLYAADRVIALGALNLFVAKPVVVAMAMLTWLAVRRRSPDPSS